MTKETEVTTCVYRKWERVSDLSNAGEGLSVKPIKAHMLNPVQLRINPV